MYKVVGLREEKYIGKEGRDVPVPSDTQELL